MDSNNQMFQRIDLSSDENKALFDSFVAAALSGFCANPAAQPTKHEHFNNLASDACRVAFETMRMRGIYLK